MQIRIQSEIIDQEFSGPESPGPSQGSQGRQGPLGQTTFPGPVKKSSMQLINILRLFQGLVCTGCKLRESFTKNRKFSNPTEGCFVFAAA